MPCRGQELLAKERIPVSKHFRGKGLELRAGLPGVQGQACLPASLLEESDAVPAVLDGHLGQKQAALAGQADH